MAYMDEKGLKKHISSKKFNNIYVIFGDEKYLVKHYTKELTEAVAGKEPCEFAFHQLSSSASVQEIADAAGVVPFMAEYNCVLLKDYDVTELRKEEYEAIVSVLNSVPDTTVVIFSYITTSGKKENAKPEPSEEEKKKKDYFTSLCKAVDKLETGCVAEINMRSATTLENQLSKWADKMGKKLSLPIASKIIYFCGTDLDTLRLELEKVCAFAGDKDEITLDMVEPIVTKKLEAKVYDMVDNVICGNTDKAYNELHQLFALKEDIRGIVRVIGFVYIDLYRARVTNESGTPMKDTAEFFKYGKREWALNKALKKSSRLSTNALRESLAAITELSARLNSSTMNEEAAVEKLIAELVLIAKRESEYA